MYRRHFFWLSTSLTLVAQEEPRKLESLLLLPEPRALRSSLSVSPPGARHTVLTPARETLKGIESYSADSFHALGISLETFIKRASAAADKRLALLKPEIIRGSDGRVKYAVYRGESELYASLLVASSLPKLFEPMFGSELWAALPDRHALYLFPARSAALQDFSRYAADPYAASPEIFLLKSGEEPRVIASVLPADE
jgi:hypothetical protein